MSARIDRRNIILDRFNVDVRHLLYFDRLPAASIGLGIFRLNIILVGLSAYHAAVPEFPAPRSADLLKTFFRDLSPVNIKEQPARVVPFDQNTSSVRGTLCDDGTAGEHGFHFRYAAFRKHRQPLSIDGIPATGPEVFAAFSEDLRGILGGIVQQAISQRGGYERRRHGSAAEHLAGGSRTDPRAIDILSRRTEIYFRTGIGEHIAALVLIDGAHGNNIGRARRKAACLFNACPLVSGGRNDNASLLIGVRNRVGKLTDISIVQRFRFKAALRHTETQINDLRALIRRICDRLANSIRRPLFIGIQCLKCQNSDVRRRVLRNNACDMRAVSIVIFAACAVSDKGSAVSADPSGKPFVGPIDPRINDGYRDRAIQFPVCNKALGLLSGLC